MELQIVCQGATTVNLDDLIELQGNLKDSTEEQYVKLRNSMSKYGFSFPVFFWQDEQGRKLIIDAHRRKFTLLKMREEGWTIPPLPADPIFAKDKTEAKKKLLLLNSKFGDITEEGLYEFTNEADSIIEPDFAEEIELPNLDLMKDDIEIKASSPTEPQELECPSCGHKFVPGK